MRCRLQKGPAGEQFQAFVLFEKSLINWTFFSKNRGSKLFLTANMAQSAARKSHNLKVASSSLTGRKL